MKRYIKSTQQYPNFTDLFDSIDAIVLVDDVNTDYSRIGITATSVLGGEDYDSYTKRELLRLTDDELAEIDTVGALNKLYEMHKSGYHYNLSTDQLAILRAGWETFTDYRVTASDVRKVLQMISKCNYLDKPSRRTGDPYKNFAELHNLDMVEADYLNILKEVKATECITKFTGVKRNSGTELFVFVHPGNGYRLQRTQSTADKQIITDDIKIYIKISINPKTGIVLSYVSFHDQDSDDEGIPMFPNYYDTSDNLYQLADMSVRIANQVHNDRDNSQKIKNQFRFDTVGVKDDAVEIVFVDSFDEDFVIRLPISDSITDENISDYAEKFANALIADWDQQDTYYRDNYDQNE